MPIAFGIKVGAAPGHVTGVIKSGTYLDVGSGHLDRWPA
jgi:hypothetical protein